jgi:hypothetical protein
MDLMVFLILLNETDRIIEENERYIPGFKGSLSSDDVNLNSSPN